MLEILNQKKINDIKQQIVKKIKQNSLSYLEKQLRKNKSIKISDFKKVVQEINNQCQFKLHYEKRNYKELPVERR